MSVEVEFEHGGRTYRVEPGLYAWDIYAIGNLRGKISLNTDLNTGEKIVVSWGDIPVMRLVKED